MDAPGHGAGKERDVPDPTTVPIAIEVKNNTISVLPGTADADDGDTVMFTSNVPVTITFASGKWPFSGTSLPIGVGGPTGTSLTIMKVIDKAQYTVAVPGSSTVRETTAEIDIDPAG